MWWRFGGRGVCWGGLDSTLEISTQGEQFSLISTIWTQTKTGKPRLLSVPGTGTVKSKSTGYSTRPGTSAGSVLYSTVSVRSYLIFKRSLKNFRYSRQCFRSFWRRKKIETMPRSNTTTNKEILSSTFEFSHFSHTKLDRKYPSAHALHSGTEASRPRLHVSFTLDMLRKCSELE